MSANKPKQQEINRKPGRDEEDFDQGRNPAQQSEKRYAVTFPLEDAGEQSPEENVGHNV